MTNQPTTSNRRWFTLAAVAAIALVALGLAANALIGPSLPQLNDNAVVITKFIHGEKFYELPFDQQRQFYKVMDDRDVEIDDAFEKKRLTESEYRAGLEAAWLGKHINRVEKYFALPPGQARTSYIAKLLEKKERKKAKGGNDPDDIDADETAAELRVEKWPSAVRTQWQLFHDTYRAQKKSQEKPWSPQTKPSA